MGARLRWIGFGLALGLMAMFLMAQVSTYPIMRLSGSGGQLVAVDGSGRMQFNCQ